MTTSGPTCSVIDSPTRVFLDANILAKPVTRTLLMVGGPLSGFRAVWSRATEEEAGRHMGPRAVSPAEVRRRFGGTLSPTGDISGRFTSTSLTDRQILADAEAAGAGFLVTEDVDDFAETDLVSVGISAVNPDVFLAARLTRAAYAMVIDLFVERQVAPPTTPAEFHSAIARQHPLLFAAHADLYDVTPTPSPHPPPAITFRGPRPLDSD
ncbi:hypothetical protein [Nocardioides sp.]|uniref:hypothetical protein n=1 Tax=Nocardioides sp. TaxID=35761 RepID=UPI0039E5DC27